MVSNDPSVFEGACAICKTRKAVRWCDFIIQYNRHVTFYRNHELMISANSSPNDETCDLPLCEKCTYEEGRADLCPHHHKLHSQAELPKHLRKYQQQSKAKIMKEIMHGERGS